MGSVIQFPVSEARVTEPSWDGFYSLSDVSRLAEVPIRTLNEWRLREILVPSVILRTGNRVDEGYTYADVTIIRLMRVLREDRINFDSAQRALKHMYDRLGPPSKGWSGQRVYFHGRNIFVEGQDGWPVTDATQLGQTVATLLFGELFEELRDLDEGSSILIPKKFRKYVTIDPHIMGGEPIIRGTRLPTSMLGALVKRGESITGVVKLYASVVSPQYIRQGIAYEQYIADRAA